MLSLRQLKAAGSVARLGGFSAAAAALNRTQSALSRSVAELETALGYRLFDRSAGGVSLTPHGQRFLMRFSEIEKQFALLEAAHRRLRRAPPGVVNPVCRMEVSHRRLAAFLALHARSDVSGAAAELGVTRATIYGAVVYLERLLDVPLFEHSGPRITPSGFGQVLASHVGLAFALMQHLRDDLAGVEGSVRGSVAIGTLPYSRTLLTPRAIDRVLGKHPGLNIATREGPYATLESALRSGELDVIIGAVRPVDAVDRLATETLFTDELAVIAGASHPLAGRRRVRFEELLEYGWILPVRQTPARQLFDRYLARRGRAMPAEVIETSSLSLIRGLLLESDRLALLSRHQVFYDSRAGLLVPLPLRLEGTRRAIGLTTRSDTTPTPALTALLDELRELGAENALGRTT